MTRFSEMLNDDSFQKYYIWGSGSSAIEFLDAYPEIQFDGVIETSPKTDKFRNLTVSRPSELQLQNSRIIIASEFVEEITATAIRHGAKLENLFFASEILIHDADLVFVSYQKCGRTWLRLMLGRIFQQAFNLPEAEILKITQSPMRFKKIADEMPCLIFEHDQNAHRKVANEIGESKLHKDKKVVFLSRDPRDVILSNYYHMTFRAKSNDLSKIDFIQRYFSGIIKFYNIWADAITKDKLLIRYEDLKNNPRHELIRILNYIRPDLLEKCSNFIDEAVEYSSFTNMAQYETYNKFNSTILSYDGNENARKVRKGNVGDFKSEIDTDLQEWCKKNMYSLNPIYGYFE